MDGENEPCKSDFYYEGLELDKNGGITALFSEKSKIGDRLYALSEECVGTTAPQQIKSKIGLLPEDMQKPWLHKLSEYAKGYNAIVNYSRSQGLSVDSQHQEAVFNTPFDAAANEPVY